MEGERVSDQSLNLGTAVKAAKRACLATALALTISTAAAYAESAVVTNLKQQAAKIVDTWQKQTRTYLKITGCCRSAINVR